MTISTAGTEIRAYVEALKAHLADLPEANRADLLDDLEQHLLEVAAEADGDLTEKLGTPEEYAEELRRSAGIPARVEEAAPGAGLPARIASSFPVRAISAMWSARGVRAVRAFLPEAGPGWWVLRGYLAVTGPALVVYGSTQGRSNFPIPTVTDSRVIRLLAVAVAVYVSVRLGLASRERRLRPLGGIVSLAVIAFAIAGLPQAGRVGVIHYEDPGFANPAPYAGLPFERSSGFLQHEDGTPITNVCPYSADGTLLNGVLLFDQDGRAIVDTAPFTPERDEVERATPSIPNAYPQDLSVVPDAEAADPERPLGCAPKVQVPSPQRDVEEP